MTAQNDKTLYFFKLQAHFFDSDAIRILKSMPDGEKYVLFYLELICKGLRQGGYLRMSEKKAHTTKTLSAITGTSEEMVKNALEILADLELLEILEDGTIYIEKVEELTGSVADNPNAERQRRYQAKKRKLKSTESEPENVQNTANVIKYNADITQSVIKHNVDNRYIDSRYLEEKEKEKEREKDPSLTPDTHTKEPKKGKKKKEIPTVDQVKEYCWTRCLNVDYVRFWTYYQSIGWKGVEDWQSRIEYWAAGERDRKLRTAMKTSPLPPTPDGYRRDHNGNLYMVNTGGDPQISDPLSDLAEILEGAAT